MEFDLPVSYECSTPYSIFSAEFGSGAQLQVALGRVELCPLQLLACWRPDLQLFTSPLSER